MSTSSHRRHFLLATGAVGIGSIFSTSASAQKKSNISMRLEPSDAGKFHRARMIETITLLEGKRLFSKDSFLTLIDELVRKKIVAKQASVILIRLIEVFLRSVNIDQLGKDVLEIYKKLDKSSGEVVIAIVSIAVDSIAFVKEKFKDMEPKKAVSLVSHDVMGAFIGARAGVLFGGVEGAIVGAALGAVANSAIAALDTKV